MKTYDGIYGGGCVECLELGLRFDVSPVVKGFGYKAIISKNDDGNYYITCDTMKLKVVSIHKIDHNAEWINKTVYCPKEQLEFTTIEETKFVKVNVEKISETEYKIYDTNRNQVKYNKISKIIFNERN